MMHHSILLFVAVVGCWTVMFSDARRLHQPRSTVVDKQQHKHQYADVAAATVHTTADGVAKMEHNNNRRRLTRYRRLQAPYADAAGTGYASSYDTAYSIYADPAAPQQQPYVDPYAAYEQTQIQAQQAAQQAQAQFPAVQGQYSQYQGQPQVVQTPPQGQAQGQVQAQTQYQQSYVDPYAAYEQTQTQVAQPQATQGQGQYQTSPQAAQPQVVQGQYGQYEYQTQAEIQAASQAWAQAQAAAAQAAAQAQVQPQPQQAQPQSQQAQPQQEDPYNYLSSPYSTNTFTRPEGSTPRPEGVTGPYVASSTTTWVGYGGDDYDYDYDYASEEEYEAPRRRPDLVTNPMTPIATDATTSAEEDPSTPGSFVNTTHGNGASLQPGASVATATTPTVTTTTTTTPSVEEDPPGSYATYKARTTPFGNTTTGTGVYSDTTFYYQKQYNADGSRDTTANDMICFVGSVTGLRPNIYSVHGPSINNAQGFGSIGKRTDCSAQFGCGVHINSGFDCATAETQGVHYYLEEAFPDGDPWAKVGYEATNQEGSGQYSACVKTGFDLISNPHYLLGRAVIIHGEDGARLSCGIIEGANPPVAPRPEQQYSTVGSTRPGSTTGTVGTMPMTGDTTGAAGSTYTGNGATTGGTMPMTGGTTGTAGSTYHGNGATAGTIHGGTTTGAAGSTYYTGSPDATTGGTMPMTEGTTGAVDSTYYNGNADDFSAYTGGATTGGTMPMTGGTSTGAVGSIYTDGSTTAETMPVTGGSTGSGSDSTYTGNEQYVGSTPPGAHGGTMMTGEGTTGAAGSTYYTGNDDGVGVGVPAEQRGTGF